MKIGFVSSHSFLRPGGVKNHTLALKREFEKQGNEVKLILPREDFFQKKDNGTILLGGTFYMPGNASKANLSLNVTPFSILRKLRKEKFDILHFQNFGVFLPLQILEASNAINILTMHALMDASRLFKEVPSIINILNGYVIPKFHGLITVSNPVLSQLKYLGPKKVIPNGIEKKFLNNKKKKIEKFNKNDKFLNILFVGRLEKRKGLIYLLKAFEKLKKNHKRTRLIIVGEGERREKCENFIKRHKVADVFFEGEIGDGDLLRYYKTADICCFPSLYGEAFGIVLLEAMASSKPIVAFSNKGYKEVLKGKGENFLVKPKDINGLYKKLEVLTENEKKRKEMGKWGSIESKKYLWPKIAKDTLKFYDKVIKFKS